jgi:hypothetical protein
VSDQLPNVIATGALVTSAAGFFWGIRVQVRRDRQDRAAAHQIEIEKAEARGREKALSEIRVTELENDLRQLRDKRQGGAT